MQFVFGCLFYSGTNPGRWTSLHLLREWWCLWFFCKQAIWEFDYYSRGSQGRGTLICYRLKSLVNYFGLQLLFRVIHNCQKCFSLEIQGRWASVCKQSLGAILWWAWSNCGKLSTPWAEYWRLAALWQYGFWFFGWTTCF